MKKGGVRVKICGITHADDLEAAEGADLVGIVIDVPGSLRSRSFEEARTLVRMAKDRWTLVGVLVNPSLEIMHTVWAEVGVDWIQVHGRIPDGLGREESERVMPSIGIPVASDSEVAPKERPLMHGGGARHPYVHLDTLSGPLPGGTGTTSDWTRCRAWVESDPAVRFMLGGGLTPGNVSRALNEVGPAAVDVSGGVESRPGRKSGAKIRSFLNQVREWEGTHA